MSTARARWLAFVIVVVLLGAACSDDSSTPTTPTEQDPGGSAAGDGTSTPDPLEGEPSIAPSPSEPVFENEANVLRVAVREPSTLDPMRLRDPGSVLVARQLYEGLTRWDPVTQSVVPAVAESWKVSDGGRTFTFTLRADATFHDASPVTAEDFRFAFDRIALKRNASDVAYLLEAVLGFDQVNGFGQGKHLRGIRAPDSRTLVIRLAEPYRNFPAVLTHPSLVPLEAEAVRLTDDFLVDPLGNGPFRMARPFRPSQPVSLRAYAGFYEPSTLEGVEFVPYEDAAASWIPFTNGEVDVAEVPSGRIDPAGEEYGRDGFKPLLVGSYFGFNIDSTQLRNRRLRMAISEAINREALARRIFKGTLVPARGIVPAGLPGFDRDACGSLCDYRPIAARRIVRSLPRPRRVVTLQYTKDQPQPRVAEAVQKDLEAVGLKVRTKAYEFPQYLRLLSREAHAMFRLGWLAEYPDPDVFLRSLFDSSSPDNHTTFSSRGVDRLLARARRASTDQARARLYQRVEEAVLAQVPVAPLGYFQTHWVAQPAVQDIEFDVLGGFDVSGISLDRS